MKITIDLGQGDDERSNLLARAYVAAVVGPRRRPNGRPRPLQLPSIGTFVLAANNNTADQVMFVSVTIVGGGNQALDFSTSSNQGSQARIPVPADGGFILYPGESLAVAATTAPTGIAVVTETF